MVMPAHKKAGIIFSDMLSNLFTEKLDDWCEKEVFHTLEEVEETIQEFLKETKKDETA